MNKLFLFISIISFLLPECFAQKIFHPSKSNREAKIINSQWTFNYFPEKTAGTGYESAGYDDSKWSAISIPHTWSTFETTGELHPYIRSASENDNPYWWTGWGWYRKHFIVNKEFAGRRVFIEFEGVQKYCKVWINGNYLGDHKGGYGSFDFDITKYINPGAENVLAVAVSNKMIDEFKIPPMAAGNFDVYGGIYRDVTVVMKDNLYIPMQGSASHEGGTFVTTPEVSARKGVVRVQTWVKNDDDRPRVAVLKTTITDPAGKVVADIRSSSEIKPGELFRFDQISKPIKNPGLWSPDDPCLYRVYSEVTDGKVVTDIYESPLGFRWFRWDYKENFLYVNDKKVIIHGGNRHQEYPWLGDAMPKWITRMDFNDIAVNLNYNFMRTAHYPNDNLVYELTDKYGIAIDEESPSIKNQLFSAEVQEQQMKEMIRRDRNHPSILFWSMGNETNHAVDSKFAIAEDTTRILTARRVTEGSAGAFVRHTDENLALENLLRCTIRGWYNTDVKDLQPADAQHCGTEEHQQNMLISSGRFGTGNLCIWLYEDHGADREYLNSPLLHVNPKGYVDSYRIPKYAYYFWQANFSDKPMVFILPHFWRSQYIGQKKDINIDSNCDTVELFVNGSSQGLMYPDKSNFHNVTFKDIMVQHGTLSAVGRRGGEKVKTEVVMAGTPAKIVLTTSHHNISADRSSVFIVRADITDANSNHVYGATNTIKWSITGPAELVGPSVYESDIEKHHQMEGTMYTDMPVANVIRSSGEPGNIRISVSASGLATGSVEIISTVVNPDNSVITEPVLLIEGRLKPGKSQEERTVNTLITKEMKETVDELNLKPADKKEYAAFIGDYILGNNKNIDSASYEFKALVETFSTQLVNTSGRLIADDYNFSVDHFNKCMTISKYADNTGLPYAFKNGLKKYYARTMIINGMEKDIAREKRMLDSIPVDGNIVIVQDKNMIVPDNGGMITYESDLPLIVASIHPDFKDLPEESKDKILAYVSMINPYIQTTLTSEQNQQTNNKKITRAFYKIEKGEPIWIPALNNLLK
jgi:beta-galactosidase